MEVKRVYRWLYHRGFEAAFQFFVALQKILPPKLFRRILLSALELLIAVLIPKRRIIKNLRAAFGEMYSLATKKGLAKGVQEHFVSHLFDCFVQLVRPNHVRNIATIHGIENLRCALAKSKGVIALGAHLGNFVLLGARLGIEGYPFLTLFRLPSDSRIEKIIRHYLPSFYQRVISSRPRRSAVGHVLYALKQNQIVFILADNLKRGRVPTVLFGQRVLSPRGPVSLALRSGAPVVPMYLVRNYEGSLCLVIEPEIPLVGSRTMNESVTHNTRLIVRHLETVIRRYPDQWNWLSVRMKNVKAYVDQTRTEENYHISDAREF